MTKKKYGTLLLGIILLLVGIPCAIFTYRSSYQVSMATGAELNTVKEELVEEETPELLALKEELSDRKLTEERPYAYALTLLFLGIMITAKGVYNLTLAKEHETVTNLNRLAQAGLLAALCYIGFAIFKIDIPVGPEKTAFHFGNVFCVLAALLLGGYWGGLAGAVGMTIGDLTTSYVTSAPKTFLLKLCIGLIVGFVAHRIFKLSHGHSQKYITGVTILASSCGMLFNVFADPLVGYYYKTYLLGVPQDISAALAKINTLTTAVNAVVAVIVATVFYLALRPALLKAQLLVPVSVVMPEQERDTQ